MNRTRRRFDGIALVTIWILVSSFIAHLAYIQSARESKSEPIVVGGAISDVQAANGKIYAASGNKLVLYAGDGNEIEASISLPVYPTCLAVDSDTAVLASGVDILTIDLDTFAISTLTSDQLQLDGSVTDMVISDGILAISTTVGDITIFNMASGLAITSVRLDSIISGNWAVMEMDTSESAFYAVLYESQPRSHRVAVVVLKRNDSGSWKGFLVEEFSGQQPQELEVDGFIAGIMSANEIRILDMTASPPATHTLAIEPNVRTLSISIHDGMLFVLRQDEFTTNTENTTLSSYILSDGISAPPTSTISLAYDPRRTLQLATDDSRVYAFGDDEIIAYNSTLGQIDAGSRRSFITVAITSIAYLKEADVLLAAREGGLCIFDFEDIHRHEKCEDNGFSGQELTVAGKWVIGSSEHLIFSASVTPNQVAIVGRIESALPTDRYVDAIVTAGEVIALVDANPPRSAKTHFRVEWLTIEANGALIRGNSRDIETPPCGTKAIRASSNGKWLGILCGKEVLEYQLDEGTITSTGSILLPGGATAIDIDQSGIVAVGTLDGLMIYNSMSKEKYTISATFLGEGIIQTRFRGECIVTLQSAALVGRRVMKYCKESAGKQFIGVQLYWYDRIGSGSRATQIATARDGVFIVTGNGTAVLLNDYLGHGLAFLPFILRSLKR